VRQRRITAHMTETSTLLRILPYAGTLPFVGCAVLLLTGVRNLLPFGDVTTIALAYGLAIVSFMAGVHWGQYLAGVRTRVDLLISSNMVALVAWSGFLLLPKLHFCLLLIVLFIVLNSIDGHLHHQGAIDRHYRQLRNYVTAVVCLSLLVAGFA
jgi:hypothetical protein